MDQIYMQTKAAEEELAAKAKVQPGHLVVVGCSTSEVLGAKIGTNSSPDTAGQIFKALHDCAKERGFYMAGLGPRILRTETASGFALACISCMLELGGLS